MPRIKKVMATQEVRDKFTAAGIEPAVSDSPEAFGAFVKAQAETRSQGHQAGRDQDRVAAGQRYRFARTPIRSSRGSTSSQK